MEANMPLNFPASFLLIFGTGVGLVILANFVFYVMLGEVNARSPSDQQISMFGVNTKLFSIMRRHAELFPHSRKRVQMMTFFCAGAAIAVAGFAIAVAHYSGS
jgi:hypothetical protein